MQATQTVLFFLDAQGAAQHEMFEGPTQLPAALARARKMRGQGLQFVATATVNVDCVSPMGVDAISKGALPSGQAYGWNKRYCRPLKKPMS